MAQAPTYKYMNQTQTRYKYENGTFSDTQSGTKSSFTPTELSGYLSRSFDKPEGQSLATQFGVNYGAPDQQAVNPSLGGKPLTTGSSFDKPASAAAPLASNAPVASTQPVQQPQAQYETQTRMDGRGQPYQVRVPVGTTNPSDTASKYAQGFEQTKASGMPAPSDAGTARSAIQGMVPPAPSMAGQPDNQLINATLTQNKGLNDLMQTFTQFMSPPEQQKSLTEEYQSLIKSSGLEGINTELINAKNVIEGTEDDIRHEITKAGGFATNSQVQALAAARNKTLIKNYNMLLDQKNSITDQINTTIGLEEKDRAAAQNQMQNQLGIATKLLDMQTKMQDNARSSYQNIIDNGVKAGGNGYDQLYQATGGDPYYTGLVENSLGLAPGSLQQLASQPVQLSEKDKLDLEYKKGQIDLQKSNLATDKLQRANISSQINERNNPQTGGTQTLTGKPQNATQTSANGYADRVNEANIVIDQLGSKFTGKLAGLPLPNFAKSGDRQAYEQAKRNFVNAVLRRESGAAISPTEFESAEKQYFPQPGDKTSVVQQKEVSRNTAINNLYREANVARPVKPGQIIESNGKKYKVGSDGETLTEI